ncbi:molybdenum ABC transporter, periplasmic molybdate-binding protein [Chloroherpeton thalassium ATCC 35110]|uniref:Molybdenum ABC transporter, periplasmic molybdate-binding protein n=1 Tax=Chloroherpeton thalassium (strain ATCC 35110 / GB-78) TaxID=517418 RepID=B3QUW5_CHLT3|nr:molybdate ABC transporter substrate-binding protein [Chloroherpeton thalassium]ACF14466.1 molybdenum ABC transporter, periplasmic molybdate-binding protein [Chloroherpeton thalassium ATCC 35110]
MTRKIFSFGFICFFLFAGFLSISGCGSAKKDAPLRIAAAANLSYLIDELKKDFEKTHPGIDLEFSRASSGKLVSQIMNGAPYDVFLSADMSYPERLTKEGFADGNPIVYAKGKLILFSAGKISLKDGLQSLKADSVKTVALANPELAPYGKATLQALEKCGLSDLKSKFVIAENVSQAVQFSLNATDAGFIPKSAIYAPALKSFHDESVHWIAISDSLYEPILQGAVLLKRAEENSEAKLFMDYLQSDAAKNIFESFGYGK